MPNVVINRRVSLGLTSGLTPLPVSGAKVWYNSTGLSSGSTTAYGVVNGSGEVTQWTDLTGNGNHATYVGGVGTAPDLSGTIGGKNAINFDGVLDNLQITNLSLFKNLAGITIFVVSQSDGIVGGVTENELVFIGTGDASRGRISITQDVTSGKFRARTRRVEGDDTSHQLLGNTVSTSTKVHASVIDFSTGYNAFYENGVVVNWDQNSNSTTGNCGNVDSAQISIGNLIHATNYPYDGRIAEVIIYDSALTSAQIDAVNASRQSYYGISRPADAATQAETTTYLNRLSALGYTTPSTAWITAFNNLIYAEKTNGNFALTDAWGLFLTETENPSLVDIKDTTKSVTVSNTTWNVRGFIGNGSSAKIASWINLSSGTTNYTQNSGMVLVYGRKTGTDAGVIAGAQDAGGNRIKLYPRYTDGKIYGGVNNNNGTNASATNFSAFNVLGARRPSGTAETVFFGNELETSGLRASSGRPNVVLNLLCHNNNGVDTEFYNGQITEYLVASSAFDRDSHLVNIKTFEAAIGILS